MRRLFVDPDTPDAATLGIATSAVRDGAVIAIPTDTLYGLAVDPFQMTAVERLFQIKARSEERAVPLIAADTRQIVDRMGPLTPLARALAARFWPGPLTLLVHAPLTLPSQVTAGTGKVGVRVPAHAVPRLLCASARTLLTATSANISGRPPTADPDDVARTLEGKIDLLLDAGPTPGGPPSTIVDVSGSIPVLVRTGAIGWDDIEQALSHLEFHE